MPSVSKSQQRLMGMAYAVKDGSLELSDIDPAYRDKVKSLSDGMTKKDLKKYASTKHDKLPETVDEAYIGPFVFNDRMSDEELKGMYDAALDGYAYHQKGMQYAKSDYKKAYQEIEKILKKRGVAVDEDFAHAAQNITPSANIGGMGPVLFPQDGVVGSGDVPAGPGIADIDDDEEEAKKDNTKKKLEMENFKLFTQFNDFVNEAMDYNDPVLVRSRVAKMRADDMKKLDALKKKEEKERKKAMKRWNQKKYDKWLEDVASNGGWENAFDMAQNAEHEPGLIDWVKKEFPYDDAYQRIQWDIEAFAESVVTEAKAKGLDWVISKLGDKPDCYDVADFVYTNYDKVTGLRKSMRNDEMDFPEEIMDVVDHYGLDDDEFTDCYGMAAESVVTEATSVNVGEYIKTEYGHFYKRVAGEVGGQEAFVEISKGKEKKRKTSIHNSVSFEIVDKEVAFESAEPITEKKLDRDDMIKWIEKYMDFVRTTEEFNGSQGGIWVSGENGDEYKGRVIYDYYSEDYKNRTFGVDNRWEKELNKRGWYSEWHDAGTSMIWPL